MPKSYYTLVQISPNLSTDDRLSIGLIGFDESTILVKFSKTRQEIAKKLLGNGRNIVDYISEQIEENLKNHPEKLQEKVAVRGTNGQHWIANYLEYLQKYANGTLKFSETQMVLDELSTDRFEALFHNWLR